MTGSWSTLVGKARRFRNAHWPRYVFIHINKTAGSSIERALHLRFEHKTAAEKRSELGNFRWNRAFKFSFVRNPWDKVYSHYKYRVATNQTGMGDGHIQFSDWVLRAYGAHDPRYYDQPKMFMQQIDWMIDTSGECILDYVGRFESLIADFRHVCEIAGISAELPHLKKSDPMNYRSVYSTDARSCIAESFRSDTEVFGYRF